MLRAAIQGLRNLVRRKRASTEIDEEVRAFYYAAVEHRKAEGMSAEEARRAARRDLGSYDAVGEQVHASRWESVPQEIARDIRFGIRMLVRNPGFTAVAVVTLAVAIGSTTTMFSVVNAALLRPLPFPHPDRLMFLWEQGRDGTRSNVGYATFEDWRKMSRSFSHISVVRSWAPTLVGQSDAETLSGLRMSAGTFEMLGAKLELGRDFVEQEDKQGQNQVAILSHALWQRRFNSDPAIVGKAINIDGKPYTVVGVLAPDFPPVFSMHGRMHDIYSTVAYNDTLSYACRDCRHLRAIARLADGVTERQAHADMDRIMGALLREYPKVYTSPTVPFTPVRDYLVGDVRPVLVALAGAVGFVLLIACVNVANLLLGWGAKREHEFALRASLGAKQSRLSRQLLTESCVLFLIGGGAGLAIAYIAVSAVSNYAHNFVPSVGAIVIDLTVCGFALSVSLVTAIVFGLVPAMRTARSAPAASIGSGRSTATRERDRLRNVLVVSEIALALVLVTGAALMTKSFIRLLEVNPGFDIGQTLTLDVDLWGDNYKTDDQEAQFFGEAIRELKSLPGVEAAAITSQVPLGGNMDRYAMHIADKPNANPADDPDADRYSVSPDYFRAMQIPVISGRAFDENDRRNTQPVAVINETFAKKIWPGENPLGKQIRMGGLTSPPKIVIGVVGDVLHDGLDAERTMQVYLPYTQMTDSNVVAVVRAKADPARLKKDVVEAVRKVDALQPVSKVETMREMIMAATMRRRLATEIFLAFAGIALLLTAVGTYGVISYQVAQRTREIGIRMALGADRGKVLGMVLRRGIWLALIGTVLGVPLAAATAQVMTSLLFSVPPVDVAVFATVPVCMMAITALACWIPARRATRVEPTVALRYE